MNLPTDFEQIAFDFNLPVFESPSDSVTGSISADSEINNISEISSVLKTDNVIEGDFTVVQQLDWRRHGVLLHDSFLSIKEEILRNAARFTVRGLHIEIA